jgi:hypothetical protein
MVASAVHYNKSAVGSVSVLAVFLRHLNTGTLALALFVALALLTAARGKEPEARMSAHARDTESRLTMRPCDTSLPDTATSSRPQIQRQRFRE